MNIEDIKVGETYNVRVTVTGFKLAKNAVVVWACGGHPCYFSPEDFSPISPENGIKNTETAPKYDPNRKFRKGDKVRVVAWNGRRPITLDRDFAEGDRHPFSPECVVIEDEDASLLGTVKIQAVDGAQTGRMIACFLELVTPVEARVSFRVGDFPVDGEWSVWKDSFGKTEIISSYKIATHPHAKESAEAERDRLNAEYRKEREIRNEIIEIDKAINKEILNHAHAFLTRKEQA